MDLETLIRRLTSAARAKVPLRLLDDGGRELAAGRVVEVDVAAARIAVSLRGREVATRTVHLWKIARLERPDGRVFSPKVARGGDES